MPKCGGKTWLLLVEFEDNVIFILHLYTDLWTDFFSCFEMKITQIAEQYEGQMPVSEQESTESFSLG
jgi:hypothetical protein